MAQDIQGTGINKCGYGPPAHAHAMCTRLLKGPGYEAEAILYRVCTAHTWYNYSTRYILCMCVLDTIVRSLVAADQNGWIW